MVKKREARIIIRKQLLPGQGIIWHATMSIAEPAQEEPPWAGAGLVQVRLLCFSPGPQVLEHSPYAPHSAQFPFTKIEITQDRNAIFCGYLH